MLKTTTGLDLEAMIKKGIAGATGGGDEPPPPAAPKAVAKKADRRSAEPDRREPSRTSLVKR